MDSGDGGLECVWTSWPHAQGAFDEVDALFYLRPRPLRTVLVLEEDQFAGGVEAGVAAGILEEHEGKEAERFGFIGHERGYDACEANGLGAEVLANQVIARG